jgi:hypothetical protein
MAQNLEQERCRLLVNTSCLQSSHVGDRDGGYEVNPCVSGERYNGRDG